MTLAIRIGWMAIGLAAAVAVPFRVAEIAAAHNPGALICVATARDASPPTFAVSHTKMNQGNLIHE